MNKSKRLGIGKSTLLTVVLGAFAFLTIAAAFISWVMYYMDYPMQKIYDHGIEVEAEIIKYYEESVNPGETSADNYIYRCYYYYKSESGIEYEGLAATYQTQKAAEEQIGKKIIITIDPDSSFSVDIKKEKLINRKFTRDLIIAIVMSAIMLTELSVFLTVFHKDRIDRKLAYKSKRASGKVVKIKGSIFKRLTVKYTDTDGREIEKKVYRLYTPKDARYLSELPSVDLRYNEKYVNFIEERPR